MTPRAYLTAELLCLIQTKSFADKSGGVLKSLDQLGSHLI